MTFTVKTLSTGGCSSTARFAKRDQFDCLVNKLTACRDQFRREYVRDGEALFVFIPLSERQNERELYTLLPCEKISSFRSELGT